MADDLYKTLGRFIVAANGIHDAADRYRAVVAKIREKDAARARIGELEAENARLKKSPYSMSVAELQEAIAPLQDALHHKILGDQTKGVYLGHARAGANTEYQNPGTILGTEDKVP